MTVLCASDPQGDPGARRNLAKMYNEGIGVDRDVHEAMRLVGGLAADWDQDARDVTARWFDAYVAAAAERETEARRTRDRAKGKGVPEWGGVS